MVLPLLVATGVAGMHTLGHPTTHGHGDAQRSSGAVAHEQMIDAAQVVAVAVTASYATTHGPVLPMNPVEVCLAILVAGLILLLAAIVVARLRRGLSDGHLRAALAVNGRGPPACASAGLLLADLSVMRN